MKNLYDVSDWSDIQQHLRLGEILMQCGKLSLEDLGIALDVQNFDKSQAGAKLGDILLSMRVVTKEEIESALTLQRKIDEMLERIGVNHDI